MTYTITVASAAGSLTVTVPELDDLIHVAAAFRNLHAAAGTEYRRVDDLRVLSLDGECWTVKEWMKAGGDSAGLRRWAETTKDWGLVALIDHAGAGVPE